MLPKRNKSLQRSRTRATRRARGRFRPGRNATFNCDRCGSNFVAAHDRKPYHTDVRNGMELNYWLCPACTKDINGKDIYS